MAVEYIFSRRALAVLVTSTSGKLLAQSNTYFVVEMLGERGQQSARETRLVDR
jgi:hypothetical protein